MSIRAKKVPDHLAPIIRTLGKEGRKLVVSPSICLGCGYVFKERQRLQRPGRCPRCKGSHIKMASYRIVAK